MAALHRPHMLIAALLAMALLAACGGAPAADAPTAASFLPHADNKTKTTATAAERHCMLIKRNLPCAKWILLAGSVTQGTQVG